jgi:hypothetical protein
MILGMVPYHYGGQEPSLYAPLATCNRRLVSKMFTKCYYNRFREYPVITVASKGSNSYQIHDRVTTQEHQGFVQF